MEVIGQIYVPAALSPRERDPVTHGTGGWVGSRAGLDAMAENSQPLQRTKPRSSSP
jgi:hypothetical protein